MTGAAEVAFVNSHGAVFAGLVDADEAFDQLLFRRITGQALAQRRFVGFGHDVLANSRAPASEAAARASEKTAL